MLRVLVAALLLSATDVFRSKSIKLVQIPDGITVHKVSGTWEEADAQCKAEGAVLASPITTRLRDAMRTVIGINNTPYFIGTRLSGSPATFTSLEGVPLDNMTAAVTQMIQRLDPLDGECLSMDQYGIRVVSCCERLPFLCYSARPEYIDSPVPETVPDVREVVVSSTEAEHVVVTETLKENKKTCSEGYSYLESTGSCYKVHKLMKPWEGAQAKCLSEGGQLAVLDDEEEARAVALLDIGHDYPFTYVGLRDVHHNDVWTAVDGRSVNEVYNVWFFGKRKGVDMHCAVFREGKLDNYDCSYPRIYICEQ